MSASVRITWKDPAGKFTGVEIAVQVEGAPDFTTLDVLPPGTQTLLVPDLVDGLYRFRATAINGSKRSLTAPVTEIQLESVPGDVTELEAAVI